MLRVTPEAKPPSEVQPEYLYLHTPKDKPARGVFPEHQVEAQNRPPGSTCSLLTRGAPQV